MASSKKSRKIGQIGVRKDPDYQHRTGPLKKKIGKGHKPGSRHNVETQGAASTQKNKGSQDPRHGSKKPVPLIATSKVTTAAERRKFATPAEELAFIEADERLALLLDKSDAGRALSAEEKAYVDTLLSRHRILCELIGVATTASKQQSLDHDEALLDKLKPVDHNDFL